MTLPSTAEYFWLRPCFRYRQRFPQGYTMQMHQHDCHELMYVETGQCTFMTDAFEVTLGKSGFIVLTAGMPHKMEVRHGDCLIANVEYLPQPSSPDAPCASRLCDLLPLRPLLCSEHSSLVLHDDDVAVLPLLRGIIDEWNLGRWGSEQLIQLRLWELLIAITRLYRRHGELPTESSHARKAREYLAQHYARRLTMQEVAAGVGISRSHLQRTFREEVGITPLEYLTELRLQHAKTLLTRTDLSLLDIALRVGLESQQYLHVLFRRYLGATPGQYRKQQSLVAQSATELAG